MKQTATLYTLEQGINAAIRKRERGTTLKGPRPLPGAQTDPITVELSCRAAWGGPIIHRVYIAHTICRHIAINEAQQRAKAEGLPDTALLDVYQGYPKPGSV